MVQSYRELLVWQKGISLVKDSYRLTKKFPVQEKYVMRDQMRRAVISIPSNIAEGQARQHSREFCQFLYIALGSIAELGTLLFVSQELRYIFDNEYYEIFKKIEELRKMICSIIKKLVIPH